METCKKFFSIYCFVKLFLVFILIQNSYAEITFQKLENKKVPFLDFFLLKFENKLIQRAQVLGNQLIISRVQYSNIGIQVNFEKKDKKIFINIYAIMDRNRYSKKKYRQKLTDCNQVRNLIFYKRLGYKVFSQKRDPSLSEGLMEDIFKENFFNNLSFSDKEIEFLLNSMFVNVTILNPVSKIELSCYGKANKYELD
tara:strand:+ start:1439 stop:2029 length:591 start_codon:yes stop_codon:yes gene_type:complete